MKITDFQPGAKLRFKGFIKPEELSASTGHHHRHHHGQTHTCNCAAKAELSPVQREYRSKLAAMGFTNGIEFSIERRAPFGDPLVLKLKNYYLAIRADEAMILDVEAVK